MERKKEELKTEEITRPLDNPKEIKIEDLPPPNGVPAAVIRAVKSHQKKSNDILGSKNIPVCSAILADNSIVEMVYDQEEEKTKFAIYKDGVIDYKDSFSGKDENIRFIPVPPQNNLVKHKFVRFPSSAEEYESENELIKDIQAFIHRYLDISPLFKEIASYFVLFTWVYDRFNEVPYLRAIGDYGSGKTRFLQAIGSLCYKPIIVGGAISPSAIFHILDQFHGTLIVDEADFKNTDYHTEIIKILNQGNLKGFPVLRSESLKGKVFDPRAFDVFSPKIVATRGLFQDKALESRFLVEEMEQKKLRGDIPINLPDIFWEEAREIRNKLLMFRFRNYFKIQIDPELIDRSLEPRLNQIIIPLLSIIKDDEIKEKIRVLVREYHKQICSDRGMQIEGEVIEIIKNIIVEGGREITIKQITKELNEASSGEGTREQITSKKVGWIVRNQLKLKPERKRGGYTILYDKDIERIESLFARYGFNIEIKEDAQKDSAEDDIEIPDNSDIKPEEIL